MEQLYAFGVSCIQFIQDWFADSEGFFELVNDISNPHHATEILFPLVSIVDSVFASQLILCMAFGTWLNAVMKWWLLEDRPYWWVRETTFYPDSRRPQLQQFRQSCETGPGCPSGHSATAAMLLVLMLMWAEHVMNDRKCRVWWWKYLVYPLFASVLGAVMLARLFVATHFPHQCLLGALIGSFLAPALCIYVSDPYIWRYGFHATFPSRKALVWHVFAALTAIAIGVVTYYSLVLCGWDPQWTVKLAFRWCQNPEEIHVTTTPMFALVQSTAYMLGWALTVTPHVAQFRHDTKDRSVILSGVTVFLMMYGFKQLDANICRANAFRFYASQFALAAFKPMCLLRVAPSIASWPFTAGKSKKE